MDCKLLGSSVRGIFQAGILEWVAILFSTGPSPPRDWTQASCIAGRFFTVWATNSEHLLTFSHKLDTVAPLYVDYLWILTIFWGMELFQGGKEALKDYLHNVLQLVNSSTSTEINRDSQLKDVYSLINAPCSKHKFFLHSVLLTGDISDANIHERVAATSKLTFAKVQEVTGRRKKGAWRAFPLRCGAEDRGRLGRDSQTRFEASLGPSLIIWSWA